MVEQELTFRDIAQRLPKQATPVYAPPSELWSRISAAHLQRQRRRRVHRFAGAGLALAAAMTVVVLQPVWTSKAAIEVDWQARAQTLERQLHAAVPPDAATMLDSESDNTVSELARIDGALQKAYDNGAQKSELVPLWKQRSELLSALLAARQQPLAVTRI